MPLTVSPEEAARLLAEGYVYLDVRSEPEFAEGHAADATNLPWARYTMRGLAPNPHFVPVALLAFAKDQGIVVACKSGGRSAAAARALLDAGFVNVVDQTAGHDGKRGEFGEVTVPGWSRVGLPTGPSGTTYAALLERVARTDLIGD